MMNYPKENYLNLILHNEYKFVNKLEELWVGKPIVKGRRRQVMV